MALAHRNDPIKIEQTNNGKVNGDNHRIHIPVIVGGGGGVVSSGGQDSSGSSDSGSGGNYRLDNDRCRQRCTELLRDYTDWLSSKFTSFVLLMIMIVYWYVSIRGAMRIEAKLTPEKLFLSDSVLQEVCNRFTFL